ncbi:MAG: cob(I)yrinic acid a,c-diamide adenosyltransferase [Proteobacteria bacterium]|nr:MAG: cob(I)yrinic acid a,c-diamide adenosyltransferase [Pseudomonadota bacterium]
MKVYTRTGDKGQTSLFGGERVSKTHARVMAYGSLDELNSFLGLCVATCRLPGGPALAEEIEWLLHVQRDLFALGAWLASREASERVVRGEEAFAGARQNRTHVDEARILEIENQIDAWEAKLEPMKSFVLPGGSLAASQAQVARAYCRRAERETIALRIQYLNRLADALFVFARHLNRIAAVKEDPWI